MKKNRCNLRTSCGAGVLVPCDGNRSRSLRQPASARKAKAGARPNPFRPSADRPAALLLCLIAAAAPTFLSCGNGGGIPAFGGSSGISISYTQVPPSPLQTGAEASVIATVTNDPANMGVDWRVSCATVKCGSFSSTHTTSGGATTFTAPASLPANGDDRVNITAVATADTTKTATVTIALIGPPISITFTQPPPTSLQTSARATLIATVANDFLDQGGVDWSVTCGSSSCGAFTLSHTNSASTTTTFTAPASVPKDNTVTIVATATADKTKSVQALVTISSAPAAGSSGGVGGIFISFTQSPPLSLQTGATATVSATVSNDTSNQGVDWAVSCGNSDQSTCGSFSSVHTSSGAQTAFTAPSSVPTGNSVTITATATADKTQTVSANVTIISPQAALLSGQYAFYFTGTDSKGFYAAAGSLTADGLGNITSGEEDFADASSVHPTATLNGTYSIASDERGTMTLTTSDTGIGVNGVQTLSFIVVSPQHVLVIELDSSATSKGGLDLQDSTSFSQTSISGGYSFSFSGVDLGTTSAMNVGGVMTADGAGNFKTIANDVNNGGTVSTNTFSSGTYTAPDSQFGRGTATLGSSIFAYYVVDSGTLRLIETDTAALTAGSAFAQGAGPFSAGSLSGNYAFTVAGKSTGTIAAGGLFAADGKGAITSATLDVNNGGTVTNGAPTGTYSIDSNGRGTLTFTGGVGGLSQFALYVTSSQGVLLLELDSGLTSGGAAAPQSTGISASTFTGNYAASFDATTNGGEEDFVGQVVSDGASALTGNADINQFGGTQKSADAVSGTFTANSNGRFTGTLNTSTTGTLNEVFYVANSSTVLLVDLDASSQTSGPATGLLQLQAVNVIFTQPPPATLQVGAQAALIASVANDSTNAGVDWSVSCGNSDASTCGSFSSAHTASGAATTFTAPTSVPTGNTVTITASSSADKTKTVTATVTITGASVANISIAFTQGQEPPASLETGGAAAMSATVTNDATNAGVVWSVSCGNSDQSTCGSFSSNATDSGATTTYTAPATVPTGGTVTITAAAKADPTKTVTASVGITSTSVSVTIQFTVPPPTSMQTGATAQVSATVTPDTSNQGVDWTVTCQSSDCGSFNPTHTDSSIATTYTGPASVPTGNNVTIIATATAEPTQSAQATVAIKSAGRVSLLSGQYAFSFAGTNGNGFYAAVGSLTADGAGNITTGEEDFADPLGAHPVATLTGTYTIGSDSRGTITLTTNDAGIGVNGVQTLSFVVVSSQHDLITNFDTSGTSSGSLDLQTSGTSASGGYSFAFSGVDLKSGAPPYPTLDLDGVMTLASDGTLSGTEDINDNGVVTQAAAVSGRYDCSGSTTPDSFGRGTAVFGSDCLSATATTFVYYVVDSTTIRLLETDNNFTAFALTAGPAYSTGTVNTTLSGSYAFTVRGSSAGGAFSSLAAGGVFTASGSSVTSSVDVNNAGAVTNGTPSGSYSIDSSGRGTITFTGGVGGVSQFGLYVTQNQGILLLELDSGFTSSGVALGQSSSISGSAFQGNYAASFDAAIQNGQEDLIGVVSADGLSALGGKADINQFGQTDTQTSDVLLSGTFAANSNGRFTGTLNTSTLGTLNEYFYIVNAGTVLFIESDASGATTGPASGLLQFQQFLTVGFTQPPPAYLQPSAPATLTAIVSNDTSNQGVDWTVTCGNSDPTTCGSFTSTHTDSSVSTTYNAPASIPTGNTVTITATASADNTVAATAIVTISSSSSSITVTLTDLPPDTMHAGDTASVSATVTGDSTNAGVDWSVTCGGSDCGQFTSTHTDSGMSTTYDAPATVPTGNTVIITAASTADPTRTASATVTIIPPLTSIAFNQAPPASLQTSATAQMSATVSNDPTFSGVDWSVTCGSSDCGSFSPAHTDSNALTTYTAPSSVPAGDAVTITASATSDPTQTVTATVTITAAGSVQLLSGQYAFILTGTDTNGFYAAVGSVTLDGKGNVSGGEEDFADPVYSTGFNNNGNPANIQPVGSSYTIGADGRGTLTLNTDIANLGSNGVQTLSLAIVNSSHTLITEFDGGATSSGSLDVQTPADFSESAISGGYSFVFSGIDLTSCPPTCPSLNLGGVLTADGKGNFTSGNQDRNDGGKTTQNASVTGTYSAPDSFGRGSTAAIGSDTGYTYYIVDSQTIRFIDGVDFPDEVAGSAYAQGSGPFSQGSLSGTYAFTTAGKDKAGGTLAIGGLFTSDGSSITSSFVDVNDAGAVSNGTPTATYTVSSNGRGTLTFSSSTGGVGSFALYFTSSQGVLLLDLDALNSNGAALSQSSTTFSSGAYALNFDGSTQSYSEQDLVGQVTANTANLTLTGNADINQLNVSGTSNQLSDTPLTGTFSSDASGRLAGTLVPTINQSNVTLNEIFYVVDSSTVLFLETDPATQNAGPATGVLQSQNLNSASQASRRPGLGDRYK